MNRREILLRAFVAPFLAARPAVAAPQEGHAPFRRVRPADPDWPSPDAWKALEGRLQGSLLRPSPILEACSADRASTGCAHAMGALHNPFYLGDQPGGTQISGWLDAWSPQPSAYAVLAQSSSDVVAAVDFARRHRLRLVVKGGAHSYQGTSNAPDSLLVWTRAMSGIELHERFVPKDCEGTVRPGPAVSVQAGCMWVDVYDAVTTRGGRYVQGGGCTTVGVSGLVQSGGFGSFSKAFGTAGASLLEAEVVTADGKLRIVNATRDPDLFWALKGGGGGSFGVVTRLTLRTHALPRKFGGAEGTVKARSRAAFARLVRRFVDHYAERLFNFHWGESVTIGGDDTLKVSMVCAGLESEEADAAWKPFFGWVAANASDYQVVKEGGAGAFDARLWWDMLARKRRGSTSIVFDDRPGASAVHAWWTGDSEQVGAFIHGYESIWLPASLLAPAERERLASALVAASRDSNVELHFNKGLAAAPAPAIEAARDTSMNPAVLDAFALAIMAEGSAPRFPGQTAGGNEADGRADARKVGQALERLATLAPARGSYVSESNYFNRGWQQAFWGSNYAKLRAVKDRYDPDGLLYVHHGVGSEDWAEGGFAKR
jgi:FAD/FMN-containing dehydrogenase